MDQDSSILPSDENQVKYEWLEIKNINELPLFPAKLRKQIIRLVEGEKTVMYLGNEEDDDLNS